MAATFGLKFWGTRGLISAPTAWNSVHGGNTSCIQILHEDQLIVIDTGFGATNLGELLMNRILGNKEKLTVHLFFTSFQWDHIQGLPFFHPIYFPSTTLHLYSPSPVPVLEESLDVLFDGSYSPFSGIRGMPSSVNFHQLKKTLRLGSLRVQHARVAGICHNMDLPNRPREDAWAYRMEDSISGQSLTIVTGHEAGEASLNDSVVKFAEGTDILVHDGQYSEELYASRQGWGHSTMAQAIANAERAGAGHLLLTHHDPRHRDADLQRFKEELSARSQVNFDFAREEVLYTVSARLTAAG